jgi:nitrogen-specific signal transduction histidine kinase
LYRRFAALLALLIIAVATCLGLAIFAARDTNRTLSRMADIELEAAVLARQFRGAVDDLHGSLLRIGTESADDSAAVIQQRRQRLSRWLSARLADARSVEEREILQRLSAEVRSYFLKLDGVAARTGGFVTPLDRDTLVMFDDSANRLQSMADDFAAVHDADLRKLLDASLAAVQRMRNLVFVCLAGLIAAIGVVVALLYRDVVRPLRARLFESEALLAQREKLAALGTLAAGVAHEIRNPLTAVKARLYTLRRGVSSPGATEDVQAISQEIDRLERIVRDVLGYARPADPKLHELELSAWLNELAQFLKQDLAASQITLAVAVATPVSAHVDADQLRQVVLNLVRNAQEAFAGHPGAITLSLNRERSVVRGRPAEVAVLSVTDNGPGIPAEHQARLFDPFFTTKASGTGLGLSIVARLVEQHGGEITFQSAPRAGTRFSVRLPLEVPTAQTPFA